VQKKARIVIVGGGFGGIFTALNLGSDLDVTLVSDDQKFLFKPLLYEYLSGEVEEWHIAPTCRELLGEQTTFVCDSVVGIDLANQNVQLSNRSLPYDVLVLAVGGTTNYAGVPGAAELTLPFRRIEDADRLRHQMVEALDRIPPDLAPADTQRALTFAIVGGGASGVELSTKMADLLNDAVARRNLRGDPRVLIIEMSDRVVPGMGTEIREYVERVLKKLRVEVHTETRVVEVKERSVRIEHLGNQSEIQTAGIVWVGGVRINPLVAQLDIQKTPRGLIQIGPTLQSVSHENVFAIGDTAQLDGVSPVLAGTAQLAFQEATHAAHNIRALVKGERLLTKKFEELGEAVSLGTERAAVLVEGKAFGGPLARQARFALYTSRMPTWHHRLRVGASWFFEGTTPRPLLPLGFSR